MKEKNAIKLPNDNGGEEQKQDQMPMAGGQSVGAGGTEGAYKSKMSKLSQLYDESTREFKEHQKQMGIQNMESEILQKAKRDQKKIEEYKKRFRDAVLQGSA